MTADEKLIALAKIYDTRTELKGRHVSSTHARDNLEGALIDLSEGISDAVVRDTIRRVINQLAAMEEFLPLSLHAAGPDTARI